jgi:hypothetical protein
VLEDFSDFFELELILLDDLYDGENLRLEYFFSWHFILLEIVCIILEVVLELFNELIKGFFFLFGERARFFPPFFSLLLKNIQLLFQEFLVILTQVVIVIG